MEAEDTRRVDHELEARLRSFVARRVPAPDVDDVLQDAFERIVVALPTLRDEERLAPFLYRIARSAVVDSHRARGRLSRVELDAVGEPESNDESGEPSLVEQELSSYVVVSIARLPSPYREAVTLTELEGLSQRAAAEALGISLSGMKSRVQRGREKLRALLDECCRIAVDARGRVIDCEPRDASACRCSR